VYAKPDYEGALPGPGHVKGLVVIGSDWERYTRRSTRAAPKAPQDWPTREMYKRVMGQLPGNRLGYFT